MLRLLRGGSEGAAVGRRRKGLFQHGDKVGGKQANSSGIASQSTHPPRPIARIQRLDQVALDEAEILL